MRHIIPATPLHPASQLMLSGRRFSPGTQRFIPERRAKVVLASTLLVSSWYATAAHASCNALGSTPLARAVVVVGQGSQASSLAASSQSSGEDRDEDHEDSIVGFWHTYFLSGGQVFDEGFDQFTSDGLEILNDTAPPQPANGSGTICLGVFKKIGHGTFNLRHPFWSFDAKGVLVGTGLILERIVVDKEGESYGGSFSFLTYDLTGAVTFEATGELRAHRITP